MTSSDDKDLTKEITEPTYELKVSRMDPFETYSASALALQLAEFIENSINFQAEADALYTQAEAERKKAKELQILIRKINERDKKRAAGQG